MISIFRNIKYILNHPLNRSEKLKTISRIISWQVSQKFQESPVIIPFGEKSRLIIKKGYTGSTGALYMGLHDFQEMTFLLHVLREDDVFYDVGANIGSYSILAAGECQSKTISFEPIPKTFDYLIDNIKLNRLEHLILTENVGIGNEKGTLKFSETDNDATNHVLPLEQSDNEGVEIQVYSLDDLISEKKYPYPCLLKIDVEGFETKVIKGAKNLLSNPVLKAVIIELIGLGKRYGFDEKKVHESLEKEGFSTFIYDPYLRNLIPCEAFKSQNIIYIRDYDFVSKRIQTAPKRIIMNRPI